MNSIRRIAQLYGRNVLKFPQVLDEIKSKGYTDAAFFVCPEEDIKLYQLGFTQEELLPVIDMAGERGLNVAIVALYQKQKENYLSKHPDQVMKLLPGKGGHDQDDVPVFWGCPFNNDFKEHYISYIKDVILPDAVKELWFNSEGFLGSMGRIACCCDNCRKDFREDFSREMPDVAGWDQPGWVEFMQWRFDRWVNVHAEMRKRIRDIKKDIDVLFLVSCGVDLVGTNPCGPGIDIARMGEVMDGLVTNPYFHFHSCNNYQPIETYVTEWARFMRGMVPSDKNMVVVYPGFNHPTFKRPLQKKDGLWAGVLPLAAGADATACFEYMMQKTTPMHGVYESMFEFDNLFKNAKPVEICSVVHSFSSEVYFYDKNSSVSYDTDFFRPITEAVRFNAIPYGLIPDRAICTDKLKDIKVIVLPEVTCLSDTQVQALLDYNKQGGGLIICGDIDRANEYGHIRDKSLLLETLGVLVDSSSRTQKIMRTESNHPITDDLTRGANPDLNLIRPVFKNCLNTSFSNRWQIVDLFEDGTVAVAVLERENAGRVVYIAGITSRDYIHPVTNVVFPSLSHAVLANAVNWAAGNNASPVKLVNYPPVTEMKTIRPNDRRVFPTGEFFLLQGSGYYLAVFASYFNEKMNFTLNVTLPEVTQIISVEELIQKTSDKFDTNYASLAVNIDFNDYLKIYKINYSN